MSSSAHTILVSRLTGWDADKSFEVALHLGSALALTAGAGRTLPLSQHALMLAPAVAAGFAFERPIEQRLGSPRSVAAAQIVAGAALVAADRVPARRTRLRACDAALLGVAQAAGLVPGVSRSGAMLTAARALGFATESANRIAREAALPVLLGAAALKGARLVLDPPPAPAVLVAGAISACASTFAFRRLRVRSLTKFGAYRISLGTFALVHDVQ